TDALTDDTAFAADEAAWQYREYARTQIEETPVTEDFAAWVAEEADTDADITMNKNENDGDDVPEWAKSLTDTMEQIEDRVKDLEEEDDGTKSLDVHSASVRHRDDNRKRRIDRASHLRC
ncbi:MAG: hypothetical protein ACOCY8_06420, partial [Spirochaetota bacterium]